jgi:immunity protein Imm1 of predicted polymorphic toxin system
VSYTISAYYGSDEESKTLSTREDVSDFLAFLLDAADKDADNTAAALYIDERPKDKDGLPDHEIRVGINPGLSTAALGYTDIRGSFYAQGKDSGGDDIPYFSEGHDESFPADSVVTLELIRNAITEILQTGTRPSDVRWASIHGDE